MNNAQKKEKLLTIKACLGAAEKEIIRALNHVRDMKQSIERETEK